MSWPIGPSLAATLLTAAPTEVDPTTLVVYNVFRCLNFVIYGAVVIYLTLTYLTSPYLTSANLNSIYLVLPYLT